MALRRTPSGRTAGALSGGQLWLSWQTPFSRCASTPYHLTNLGDKDGTTAYLFQLQRRQPGCLYTEVVLLRKRLVQGQLGWEVIGYRNPADQKSGRHDQALACPLMRSN